MKLGVIFPTTEIGGDMGAVREYAEATQSLGYNHILVYDHVLGADTRYYEQWETRHKAGKGTYRLEHPFHEPFVFFGWLAGLTPKLELSISVLVLPQRQTALVAKQAAELDRLCRGKFRLGIGGGWNQVEYEAMNATFNDRGRKLDEQIEVMQALWKNQSIQFKGQWHNIPHAGINPLPTHKSIPLWFGGSSDPMMKRIAKYGDGWFPYSIPSPFLHDESSFNRLKKMHNYMEKAGRDPSELGIDGHIDAFSDSSPQQWAEEVYRWESIGATHISLNTMRCGFKSAENHLEAIRQFKEAVG